jgi:hypothetical protein
MPLRDGCKDALDVLQAVQCDRAAYGAAACFTAIQL